MPIDKTKMTKEMLAKAAMCQTADDLIALAKDNGIDITREEAESYLAELDNVELDSKTLEKVAGGKSYKCPGEVCTEHCHLNQWYE
ncbi:MAG: Nif11-like leader peptide family RiPP precursor, partial [Spirochaetia bacterium]|nr:Nif11-like leader peptide family RiPP precursor [Spirochaetia bacterium]